MHHFVFLCLSFVFSFVFWSWMCDFLMTTGHVISLVWFFLFFHLKNNFRNILSHFECFVSCFSQIRHVVIYCVLASKIQILQTWQTRATCNRFCQSVHPANIASKLFLQDRVKQWLQLVIAESKDASMHASVQMRLSWMHSAGRICSHTHLARCISR